VSQSEPHIEEFRREGAGNWAYRSARAGECIVLSNAVELEVDALFAGVMALPGD
jgi:hypothetical protein